jgi:branched-subunit amino acid transport protein
VEGKITYVVAMMLATYPVRLLPFLALSDRKLPDLMLRWMKYIPPSVFAALVFPGVLIRDGALAADPSNPYAWAAAATFLAIVATRNLSLSALAGVLVALAAELLLR